MHALFNTCRLYVNKRSVRVVLSLVPRAPGLPLHRVRVRGAGAGCGERDPFAGLSDDQAEELVSGRSLHWSDRGREAGGDGPDEGRVDVYVLAVGDLP